MIAVVGPGAVGGLLAAVLHRAGEEVVAVARAGTAERLAADGIVVRSEKFGSWTAHVPVSRTVPDGSAVVLAVKAYGLADVLPELRRAQPAEILALLNGVGHARTLRDAGLAHVACASIQVESTREGTVVVHKGNYAIVTVPDDADGWRTTDALRRAGVSVRTGGTENEVLWRKLGFLAPTALLTSWADLPIGPALAHDPATTAGVVAEVAALASAEGRPLDGETLDASLRRLPPTLQSSLQRDMRRGGANELEALGGELVRLGASRGIPTPTIARVVAGLQARAAGGAERAGGPRLSG
ncbi:ketopantoate reductase family protein [Georgenia sp. SYP-B2076]|uniref:ketopantoate reductase family protein n=1 Tax=Georgenia sp. SYP-B2076 TaxID=2495881 RepID=UPI000F8DE05B|nr:2-dehydropantoate 2-reductase [Georgenia sp. SYP-B2076]